MCLLAAGLEGWRYVLLIRGRTEVLPAGQVRLDDALVTGVGWAALLLAVAAALTLVPGLGRTADFAAARVDRQPSRTPGRRLGWLLIPGWNLYGAGVVLAEVDASLRLTPGGTSSPGRAVTAGAAALADPRSAGHQAPLPKSRQPRWQHRIANNPPRSTVALPA